MNNQPLPVSGQVKIFFVENLWVCVAVAKEYTEMFRDVADRGLMAITATAGSSIWDTSLMPMGDGTHFIPLNAKVRKKENVEVGDHIGLSFIPRKRES